jgi:hypothetical protein
VPFLRYFIPELSDLPAGMAFCLFHDLFFILTLHFYSVSSPASFGTALAGAALNACFRQWRQFDEDSSLRDERLLKGPRFASESRNADTASGSVFSN